MVVVGHSNESYLESTIAKAPDPDIAKSLVELDELATGFTGHIVINDSVIAQTPKRSDHILAKLINQLHTLDLFSIGLVVL